MVLLLKKRTVIIFLSLLFVFCTLFYFFENFRVMETTTQPEGVFVPIIMYHSVLTGSEVYGDYIISTAMLEKDLQYLQAKNYHTVTVKDLIGYVYEDKNLPENPVVLSFDDGYYNNYTHVLPLLKQYDMRAVISIVGQYTETFSNAEDRDLKYSYLTWKDIGDLANSGYFEIGNHTYDMHEFGARQGAKKKTSETPEAYAKAFKDDVKKLQTALTEKAGITPVTFTYPFGYISPESVPLLKEMGFKASLSCHEEPNFITKDPESLFNLNRYNRSRNLSTADFMKRTLDPNKKN